jgi:hypothetical protein
MSGRISSFESRYAHLVAEMSRNPGVTCAAEGKGFGSSGQLKVGGRIFAMVVRGELVLKLPAARVAELVTSGEGQHFDAGKGKPMREWLVLSADSDKPWLALTREAHEFVMEKT